MRKIILTMVICAAITAIMGTLGCRTRIASAPGPTPTYTNTPQPLVIYDGSSATNTNSFGGVWVIYTDQYNCTPPVISSTGTLAISSPGYNTAYAVLMSGDVNNLTCNGNPGALKLAVQLYALNCTPQVDVSNYTGIRFYCKGNIGAVKMSLPYVQAATCANLDSYNSASANFNVTVNWTQISIPFANFTVGGAPMATVLKNMTEIQWQTTVSPMSGAVLWVGETEFYK